jgi:hypothetical protein
MANGRNLGKPERGGPGELGIKGKRVRKEEEKIQSCRAVCCFTLGKTIRRKSKNDGQPTGAQPTQLETANGPVQS